MLAALLILSSIIFISLSFIAYTYLHPEFGAQITKEEQNRFAKSKQWNGKTFKNNLPVDLSMSFSKIVNLLADKYRNRKIAYPIESIPVIPFDKKAYEKEGKARFIWYGHSVILLRIKGLNILIDPMFGDDVSPIAPMKTKRFSENTLQIIDELPEIDIVCMSHDHYDHLDLKSIKKLKNKTTHFYTALGVGRHLKKWGIAPNKITEMDWSDECQIGPIRLIFTESRHFGGRGLFDRNKSLWGGWIIQTAENNIYWSGDGGYGDHFKAIGEKYGPFDLGFMECGQYNKNWEDVHMTPEESVQAAIEANVKVAMPVHCNGFALAMHSWDEPQSRFFGRAADEKVTTIFVGIGELIEIK